MRARRHLVFPMMGLWCIGSGVVRTEHGSWEQVTRKVERIKKLRFYGCRYRRLSPVSVSIVMGRVSLLLSAFRNSTFGSLMG